MSDEFKSIAPVLSGEIVEAIPHTSIQNPAFLYLRSLGSLASQRTMYSFLNCVADVMAKSNIKDFDWAQLRRHHLHALIGILRDKEMAPTTINTYIAAIKGVSLEAWTSKQMDLESYQLIKTIKAVKGFRVSKGRALLSDEIKALFKVCDDDPSPKGKRDAALIAVLLGCGLRRSEIVSLDMVNLNVMDKTLIVMGKGNKERLSFMPPQTFDRLSDYIANVRGNLPGALFLRIRRHDTETNERLTDQAIHHVLETRRKQANLSPFSPHDLRRSFATKMFDNGEDIITVKDAMGHASIKTTENYDKRSNSRLQNAATRFKFDN